jgi:aminoglycoside 6-adenylyltransferase
MREEKMMLQLILDFAHQQEDIRAVVLNGSRVNNRVKKDIYQDFDIVYYVRNYKQFIKHKLWEAYFQACLIKQSSFDMMYSNDTVSFDKSIIVMMQFKDGNRIDMTIFNNEYYLEEITKDSLTKILLDKDQRNVNMKPNESSYYLEKPSKAHILSCINEAYWVSIYVIKGILRNELYYAYDHLNIVRKCVYSMLSWRAGIDHGFRINIGKSGKFLHNYLDDALMLKYDRTYSNLSQKALKEALMNTLDLFYETADYVSSQLEIPFDKEEASNVYDFIVARLLIV